MYYKRLLCLCMLSDTNVYYFVLIQLILWYINIISSAQNQFMALSFFSAQCHNSSVQFTTNFNKRSEIYVFMWNSNIDQKSFNVSMHIRSFLHCVEILSGNRLQDNDYLMVSNKGWFHSKLIISTIFPRKANQCSFIFNN